MEFLKKKIRRAAQGGGIHPDKIEKNAYSAHFRDNFKTCYLKKFNSD